MTFALGRNNRQLGGAIRPRHTIRHIDRGVAGRAALEHTSFPNGAPIKGLPGRSFVKGRSVTRKPSALPTEIGGYSHHV